MARDDDLLRNLERQLGTGGLLIAGERFDRSLTDYLGRIRGQAVALALPRTTEQVAAVVRECAEAGVAVVPQGGNTGLVGGGVPTDDGRSIVLSLARMRAVRAVYPDDYAITVEAGLTLAEVQAEAAAAGRLFPLSLGAEGTCMIGGNIATNAGGNTVVRYGSMRDLVLGLEAVFADGSIASRLSPLRKDNTGYDLRGALCGSEGTLAIITAATLKLFPAAHCRVTCFVAISDVGSVIDIFSRSVFELGEFLTAFELIPEVALSLTVQHFPDISRPVACAAPFFVLMEFVTSSPHIDLESAVNKFLQGLLERGAIIDGMLPKSEKERAELWRIREAMVQAQTLHGPTLKHDVSVPITAIPDFIARALKAVQAVAPGAIVMPFGHVGDGNIHFNVSVERTRDPGFVQRYRDSVADALYGVVVEMQGSISAEHGIGVFRREALRLNRTPVEIERMQRLKRAWDEKNILNPGKVL